MMEVSEALACMAERVQPMRAMGAGLLDAVGLYAARDVLATVALPGFDNSAMDGYAVRAEDAIRGARLQVAGTQAAGRDVGLRLQRGQCIRIFTGAPMPHGADAVVMQEDTRREGDEVQILDDVTENQFVRRRGSDVCEGQVIIRRGDLITPAVAGLLAAQGRVQVDVTAPPRVGVLSTGDELMPAGHVLARGQIYNSNGVMLQALLKEAGVRETSALHASDGLDATVDALRKLLERAEVIVLSGGVSVGDYDMVKPALEQIGMAPDLWRVRMKPGKPFLFAAGEVHGAQRYVFGLPGNPVSAHVTFQVLVRPILRLLMGANAVATPVLCIVTGEALVNEGDRPVYVRGHVEEGVFKAVGLQRSDALYGLTRSTSLLRLEAGESVPAGTSRNVI